MRGELQVLSLTETRGTMVTGGAGLRCRPKAISGFRGSVGGAFSTGSMTTAKHQVEPNREHAAELQGAF